MCLFIVECEPYVILGGKQGWVCGYCWSKHASKCMHNHQWLYCMSDVSSFSSPRSLQGTNSYSHFLGEETQVQRHLVTCSRSHCWEVAEDTVWFQNSSLYHYFFSPVKTGGAPEGQGGHQTLPHAAYPQTTTFVCSWAWFLFGIYVVILK